MIDKEKFKRILKQHLLWLKTRGEKGKSAELSGVVDLDVADLFAAVAIAQSNCGKHGRYIKPN